MTQQNVALNLNSKPPLSLSSSSSSPLLTHILALASVSNCLSLVLSLLSPPPVREGIDWLVSCTWSNAPAITSTIASVCRRSLSSLQQHVVITIIPISCCIAILRGQAKLGAHQLFADTSEEQFQRCRQMRRGIEGGCGLVAAMVGPATIESGKISSSYATKKLRGSDPQQRFR